jgi:hypothetical protein
VGADLSEGIKLSTVLDRCSGCPSVVKTKLESNAWSGLSDQLD